LEAELKGKARLFDQINTALLGREPSASYAEIASTLGVTEASIKTAIHRYRNRYRVLVRNEIARTVDDPEEVDHEITTLIEALTD
jgi:RNA polymerase sigma-70 factor (ECF subfamily)